MNQGSRIRILKGATAVGMAGVVVGLFLLAWGSKRPHTRLANGTELSLLAVTHGPSNIFFPDGLWDKLVYQFAPAKGIHLGLIKIRPVSPIVDEWRKEDGSVAFPKRAVVWIGHSGPSNAPALPVPAEKWFSDVRATLADELGEEWELRSGVAQLRPAGVPGMNWVSSWDFTAFPRRGRTLRFRMYGRSSSNQWDTLADFKLPNPAPGPYAVWKPSNLPATQKSGDLEVSLVGLISGREEVPYGLGVRPFTRATFAVKQNGQATEAWLPDQMEASDATGNEPWLQMVDYGATNGLVNYEIQCTSLSPGEVWRMRTRFSETGAPPKKPFWTSPDLVVQNGALSAMNLKTNVEPYLITLECGKTRIGMPGAQPRFSNTIRLKLEPPPKDARLGESAIVDDQGRKATYESGVVGDAGFDAQWKIPDGAKWLKVTLSLTETRTFEFLAQPTNDLNRPH